MHENLRKMARLIRENPLISARELAELMGYAEPKSIYYWLGKIGHTFRSFRVAVLTDALPFDGRPATMREDEVQGAEPIPVAEGFGEDGSFLFAQHDSWSAPSSVKCAFRWNDDRYRPEVVSGDLLMISRYSPNEGDLVLYMDPRSGLSVGRIYTVQNHTLLVDAAQPRRSFENGLPQIIGSVEGVFRTL